MLPFVNAHTHIYSGLAPLGMPAPPQMPANFVQILERIWWRLDRAIDERSLRAAARLYVAEALLHGTSALIDHHESPSFIDGSLDVIADACHELGIRAILCYGATERNGGRREASKGLAEAWRFLRANRRPLVRGIVGLHASFTVGDATIREAAGICRDCACALHVHVAEDGADVDDAVARGYLGPLERLEALGALTPGSILAHGVHLNAAQARRADELGCWIVQNPRSNRINGVGYPRAIASSSRVALGTDGFPCDMRDEAVALAEEVRANGDNAADISRRLWGGQAIAASFWPATAPGAAADDVCQMDGEAVTTLVIDGRRVVDAGVLQTGAIDEIRAEAREAATALWARMASL